MHMGSTARIPARKYRSECYKPVTVRCLSSPQKMHSCVVNGLHTAAAIFRVVTVFITMPDVYNSSRKSSTAIGFVCNRYLNSECHTGPVKPDIRSYKR